MSLSQQTDEVKLAEEDWDCFLSMTPDKYIQETAKCIKGGNQIENNRFQKLLFLYLFDPTSSFYAQRELLPPVEMFRARVYNEPDAVERYTTPEKYGAFQGYDPAGSGVTPPAFAKQGRANTGDDSYLYTASDPQTALLEARRQPGEIVSVATIALKERAFLVDLTKSISAIDAESIEKSKWINDFAFGLASVFQAPLSTIGDYCLCQYISELIKEWGFDGIMYRASHKQELGTPTGINYVYFEPSKCEVVSSKLFLITSMNVETMPPIESHFQGMADM